MAAAWLHRLGLGARALAEVRRTEEVVGRKARTKEGRPGRRVVVVTAASENHAREVVGVVSTAQRQLPKAWRVALYDLGLEARTRAKLEGLCRVDVRGLPGAWRAKLDGSATLLRGCAWKPAVIRDALSRQARTDVLWADASIRFLPGAGAALGRLFADRGRAVFVRRTKGTVAEYTHPETVAQGVVEVPVAREDRAERVRVDELDRREDLREVPGGKG